MNSSRVLAVLILSIIVFLFLGFQLFTIQVINHEKYAEIAVKQQKKSKKLNAQRGVIIDRDKNVLAYSKDDISILVDTRMSNDSTEALIARQFSKTFGKDSSYYAKLLKSKNGNVYLEKKVSRENALVIDGLDLECIKLEEDFSRVYPYGRVASHILGFTNFETEGVTGVEFIYDKELSGKAGKIYFENNGLGEVIALDEHISQPPQNGYTVQLTVDKTYQIILEEELFSGAAKFNAEAGIGIIINPNNGEILALANYPFYNPGDIKNSSDDERRNRAITDSYEPGSTMKSITMSILLNENIVAENDIINTENGEYYLYNTRIKDSHPYKSLTVREVIEHSSNIGMSKLSEKLESNTLYKYLRDFGFGQASSIDLPGEVDGTLRKPSMFSNLSKPFISFGYEISVTPIQMAAAYSALINGGLLFQPYIVKQVIDSENNIIKKNEPFRIRRVIDESTSQKIRDFLLGVIENGTGGNAKLSKVYAGGKTGTSQQFIDQAYSKDKYNSSFIGFFPAENPTLLIYVLIQAPQGKYYGGDVAAPIFKNVAERIVEADLKVVPESNKIVRENKYMAQLSDRISADNERSYEFVTLNPDNNPDLLLNNKEKSTVSVRKTMPNLKDKTLREALTIVTELGLIPKPVGTGIVIDQGINPGEEIKKGDLVVIRCEQIEKLKTVKLN